MAAHERAEGVDGDSSFRRAEGADTRGSSFRRADVVLEGGGVKGIGLLGAIVELDACGWTFPRIAGTSAGAIVGALVAACSSAGRPLSDVVDIMRELDYRKFCDGGTLDKLGAGGKAIELLLTDGVYKGQFVRDWLAAELAAMGIRTWGDLRIDDDPDTSLAPEQRYRLVVVASDLSRGQLVRLPWDLHRYGIDVDTAPVVDSIRASMSIPFYYRPVTMRLRQDQRVTLVDGGLLSNFPIEIFDRTDGAAPRWPTFGIKLSARPGAMAAEHEVEGSLQLAFACLRTLLGAHDAYHLDDEGKTSRTIFVDTLGVSSVDFGLDRDTQEKLFVNGQLAASRFLRRR